MTDPDAGKLAFPSRYEDFYGKPAYSYGMTLRDWFAGQIAPDMFREASVEEFGLVAELTWKAADAMLKERSK